jgi:CheY-like chemotaxis protein
MNQQTKKNQQLILIDDNDIDQLLHKKIIELVMPGTPVMLFGDAQSALHHIAHKPADPGIDNIILLDIQMPVMNGFQFLEEFDQFPAEIKSRYTIYILSSSVNQFDISRAKNNPYVKDMIIKPLTKDTLLNLLKTL